MVATGGVRERRRAASTEAIVEAASALFAATGPSAVSLRQVAARAGCTHPLILQYFGTKDELVGAVATRLAERTDDALAELAGSPEPLRQVLAAARRERRTAQLLIRSALGDLPHHGFPGCVRAAELVGRPEGDRRRAERRRARLCAYAAACLAAGFVTFEGFVVAGTELGALGDEHRDAAIAGAALAVRDLAVTSDLRLAPRRIAPVRRPDLDGPDGRISAREALLREAVEQFGARGPAATSVRDLAAASGVNAGLIYRHFGSKEALLAEALERGLSEMFPAALSEDGFDFDAMSWLLHHDTPGAQLVARTLVDDIDITTVRRRFPVMRRMLDAYGSVPSGPGTGDLADPRVAVAATASMALGSAIWGRHLRASFGLDEGDGIESAIADLARVLVLAPVAAASDRAAAP